MGLKINLAKVSDAMKTVLPLGTVASTVLGQTVDPSFHAGTVGFGALTALDVICRYGQKSHTILRNYGALGALRYLMEGIGPEWRQYWGANDTEERPFDRRQRSLVYRLAKDEDVKSVAFGTLEDLAGKRMILHSMFHQKNGGTKSYRLTFGEEGCENPYTITNPVMISGMSFGALGSNAIMALSKGAALASVPMCTGEGGLSEYHLSGGCDITFQMGTGKFGVSNADGTLNEAKLEKIASNPNVKMVEIKFNQGAKPSGGSLVPGEKVNEEIAKIRGVPVGKDIKSGRWHAECVDAESTVRFIGQVQRVSGLPTGIKLCLGKEDEFLSLVGEMKKADIFPAYIVVDGAESGTGAAPQEFLDYVGTPLFPALEKVVSILKKEDVRDRTKIVASGKLIDPGSQIQALALGADAIYTGRGTLLALGCIQALACNNGTCPAGITTNDPKLQRGLVVDEKAERVNNYFKNINEGLHGLLTATGHSSFSELNEKDLFLA